MIKVNTTPVVPGYPIFEYEIDISLLPSDSYWTSVVDWTKTPFNSTKISLQDAMVDDNSIISDVYNIFNKKDVAAIIGEVAEANKELFSNLYLYDDRIFPTYASFVEKITDSPSSIVKYKPNSELSRHFDCRNCFADLITNLTNNNSSTKFYDYRNNDALIYEAPMEKGKGVVWLNCENTLHSYKNDTDLDRYVLLTTINHKFY